VEGSGFGLFSSRLKLSWDLLGGTEKSQENLTQVIQSLYQNVKVI
jgi:hypothetical protein